MKPIPFLLIVCALILSACGSLTSVTTTPTVEVSPSYTPYVGGTLTALAEASASPTPWVGGTETALAALTPTPWVGGTQTARAVLSLTPTPTVLPTFSPTSTSAGSPPFPTFTPPAFLEGTFSPVLYGSGSFLLLGGIKTDHGWLSGVQAAQFIGSDMNYEFFNPDGSIQIRGNPLEFDPTCGNHFMQSSVVLPEPMVGVVNGWISEKRVTKDLSTDDPAYVQAVTEWFESQGNSPSEIRITRILQVDIEGDGVNEVLLSASYFKEKSQPLYAETGDYSIVLMRKVMGNEVLTIPLLAEYYVTSVPDLEISYPNTYTLAEALDLNDDGTLEVIVDVRRWEGWGAIVYRVDGQNVREVLKVICE